MERTYVLSRAERRTCRVVISLSAAAAAVLLGLVGIYVCRWLSGGYADRLYLPVLGIPFHLLITVVLVAVISGCLRRLRFSVALTAEGVRVGDKLVLWDWIDGVNQNVTRMGHELTIHTWKGFDFTVEPVENASELEDLIRARLIDGDAEGEDPWYRQLIQYLPERRVGRTLRLISMIIWLGYLGVFFVGFRLMHSRFCVAFLCLVAAGVLNRLSQLVAENAIYSVALFANGIRVGDTVVQWDEVAGIEQSAKRRVAFRLATKAGRKLNVYSGLERVDELENAIRTRLAQVNA